MSAAIALIQSFDPPGLACHDLQESLVHQIDSRGEPEGTLLRRVLEDHWDLFLHRQFHAIAKEMGIDLHALEPVVDAISHLETRPGRQFNTDRTQYVEPDVHIVKVGGEYVVQLNDDGMPKLRISRAYRQMLQKLRAQREDAEAKNFIKEKLRSALWLIKSLDQRQRTIYKVAESIVRQQRDFLDSGIDRLRPMVLRDVAEDIGMHESTVSRVVSNKYMHTPRGLFPMKFFFPQRHRARVRQRYLVAHGQAQDPAPDRGEDAKRPLSDSELTRILKREGINIARRTVAKYRDEMMIPSSTQRRQIF